MDSAFRKLLLATASQVPLVVGLLAGKDYVTRHLVLAASAAIAYEIAVGALAFGKEVYQELRKRAVPKTADWIWEMISSASVGFRRSYNQHIISTYGILRDQGVDQLLLYRLELRQVFVELAMTPFSKLSKVSLDPIAAREYSEGLSIWKLMALRKISRSGAIPMVIIGAPGSGKTTLLQHVAVTFASNQHRGFGARSSVPLLLFLRDHASAITQEKPPTLGSLVQNHYSAKQPPHNWFENKLRRRKSIVLLDGLDEVVDLNRRKTISKWVDEQIIAYPHCRFILTSRRQGYLDAPLTGADVFEVQPLNAGQVRAFIQNWCLVCGNKSSSGGSTADVRQKASEDANNLLLLLRSTPALSRLTVNPLLLFMIAISYTSRGDLPGSRIELYREICEVFLGRRQVRGVTVSQNLVVLRPLATQMMKRKLYDITLKDATAIISAPLRRVSVMGEISAKQLLSDLHSNSGLFLEREVGRWSFVHHTFQEYLTATEWADHERSTTTKWKDLIDEDWWHETLRLYVAQGNATSLLQACLETDTVRSLTLAAECLNEAREAEPEVRSAVAQRVKADLESTNVARRRLAAEVQLSRRLKSLQRIDDLREIDLRYITHSEYQLFLDDMQQRGRNFQPDHWSEFMFPDHQAQISITGMRAEDALAFCRWLTQRQGGNIQYRLPTPEEALEYPAATETDTEELGEHPAKSNEIATWCNTDSGAVLIGLEHTRRETIRQQLAGLSNEELPRSLKDAFVINLDRDRDRVLAFDLGLALAHQGSTAFDHNSVLKLNTGLKYTLDLAISRALGLARDPARARNLALNLTFDLAFDLNRTRDPEAAKLLAGNRDLGLARELAGDVARSRNTAAIIDAIEHRDFNNCY